MASKNEMRVLARPNGPEATKYVVYIDDMFDAHMCMFSIALYHCENKALPCATCLLTYLLRQLMSLGSWRDKTLLAHVQFSTRSIEVI